MDAPLVRGMHGGPVIARAISLIILSLLWAQFAKLSCASGSEWSLSLLSTVFTAGQATLHLTRWTQMIFIGNSYIQYPRAPTVSKNGWHFHLHLIVWVTHWWCSLLLAQPWFPDFIFARQDVFIRSIYHPPNPATYPHKVNSTYLYGTLKCIWFGKCKALCWSNLVINLVIIFFFLKKSL